MRHRQASAEARMSPKQVRGTQTLSTRGSFLRACRRSLQTSTWSLPLCSVPANAGTQGQAEQRLTVPGTPRLLLSQEHCVDPLMMRTFVEVSKTFG